MQSFYYNLLEAKNQLFRYFTIRMPYLSIITPAYNEEGSIEALVRRVEKTFQDNQYDGELIVVDDGSTDNTAKILHQLLPRSPFLKVLHNPARSGLTSAVRRGLEEARGSIIVFPLPADLQSDPVDDVPKLMQALGQGYDVAQGRRTNRERSIIKKISSSIFNATARMLFGQSLHDLGWVKACRRDVVLGVEPLRSDWHRFFSILAAEEGFKVIEISMTEQARTSGESKFGKTGFGRVLGAFFDLFAVKFLLTFSKKPMFIFGLLGVFFFLLGTLGALYLLVLKIVVGTVAAHIPLLFAVMLLILSGIQFFAFGFLAEMIASIKDRMK